MLAAGLADAARARSVPLQVNAFGSLLTPFFTVTPVRDYESALTANTTAYATFFRGMLARGIYPPPSQFEAWFLSAAHTDADVKKTIAAAEGGDEGSRQEKLRRSWCKGAKSSASACRTSRTLNAPGSETGESSLTRSTDPCGSSTCLPSVAAMVPPPPIRCRRARP